MLPFPLNGYQLPDLSQYPGTSADISSTQN